MSEDPQEGTGKTPSRCRWRRYGIHLVLFLATCGTTYLAQGPAFAATLMAILLTHEMGHYLMARRHGVDASLPYFIPLPLAFGTLGAVIRMRSPIKRRDALMDIGAAGPLAGLAVALPLLLLGLWQSPVVDTSLQDSAWIEGNSILYILLKLLAKGLYLPADGFDVQLGPVAMAAWAGMLVTFINLLPIGQLDGGHVAVAFFGDQHERRSPWLHLGLLLVGVVAMTVLALEARGAGATTLESLTYGASTALPWFIWAGLILGLRRLSGGLYHPAVGSEPLSASRRALFWLVLVVFVLIFTPVPMREALWTR
ncbi:MAG: site-2 protease family protein [Pseudomonadota bacterium]